MPAGNGYVHGQGKMRNTIVWKCRKCGAVMFRYSNECHGEWLGEIHGDLCRCRSLYKAKPSLGEWVWRIDSTVLVIWNEEPA